MQLASVVKARCYGIFQIEDLNPRGMAYLPDIATALVERYDFKKFPTKVEDFDESKGVEFEHGRTTDIVIDKVVILNSGVYVDTRTETAASEAILHEALKWLSHDFGLIYSPSMIKRRAYISEVTFHSIDNLLGVHPMMREFSRVVSREIEENFQQPLVYEAAGISLMYDKLKTAFGPAAFTIQRREGVPFSENKYYSSAPIKTETHLKLLEQFEDSIIANRSLGARS